MSSRPICWLSDPSPGAHLLCSWAQHMPCRPHLGAGFGLQQQHSCCLGGQMGRRYTRCKSEHPLAGKVLLVWSVASDAKNSTGSPPTFTSSIDLWEGIASSSSSSTVSSPSWEGGAEVVSGEISGHSISSCRRDFPGPLPSAGPPCWSLLPWSWVCPWVTAVCQARGPGIQPGTRPGCG